MSELQVLESVLFDPSCKSERDHGRMAFRVGWISDPELRHYRLSPVPFVRRADAEAGLRALKEAGVVTVRQFEEMDDDEARRIMCSSLQW